MTRLPIGPLALLVPLFLAALGAAYLLERPPAGAAPGRELGEAEADPTPRVPGLAGSLTLAGDGKGATLEVHLAPWPPHLPPDGPARELRERGLARHLRLPEGRAFRLRLALARGQLSLGELRVRDGRGEALVPLAARLDGTAPRTPLAVLLATNPGALLPGQPVELLLWGRPPETGATLELDAGPAGPLRVELAPAELDATLFSPWSLSLESSEDPGARDLVDPGARDLVDPGARDLVDPGARDPDETGAGSAPASAGEGGTSAADGLELRVEELTAEVERLERELAEERFRREKRELAWFDYNRALAALGLEDRVRPFEVDGIEEQTVPVPPEAEPEPDPAVVRARAIRLSLSTLMRREGLFGLDLIELGRLDEGWAGPAVFRLLDDRGRLTGSLFAERLRLEGSRAARSLTIVLEEGYETHGGERVPFAGRERRVVLPFVDPEPWVASLPELFAADVRAPADDGLWDLDLVRERLNELFAVDTSLGWYRLKAFGGVVGDELAEVHLEVLDAEGRLGRRIFADRMSIVAEDEGIRLELRDGALVRGDSRSAFLNGHHRIFLPSADVAAWRAAGLPGLASPTPPAPEPAVPLEAPEDPR